MSSLSGIRVLELAGLAPGPFTGLMLADYGASVVRVDRVTAPSTPSPDVLVRGKSSICIDLKSPDGRDLFLKLIPNVDVLIDPFRPGVLEKLGLDPKEVLMTLNPRLIVARLTGFRRDGKYAAMAGHDLNYLAVSGVLSTLGPANRVGEHGRPLPPSPPGNLLADFAGGGHMCFTGILLAIAHRARTGEGQIVESNMVDGVSYLATMPRLSRRIPGQWDRPRGENLVDGGCPYYGVYECKDEGRYMSVAALEPQFFKALCQGLKVNESDWGGDREDKANWPKLRVVLEEKFRTKVRTEWEDIFQDTDACCLPVLSNDELEEASYEQRPAVTLSRTPSVETESTGWDIETLDRGKGGEDILKSWLGWKKGKDFVVHNGGLALRSPSKL